MQLQKLPGTKEKEYFPRIGKTKEGKLVRAEKPCGGKKSAVEMIEATSPYTGNHEASHGFSQGCHAAEKHLIVRFVFLPGENFTGHSLLVKPGQGFWADTVSVPHKGTGKKILLPADVRSGIGTMKLPSSGHFSKPVPRRSTPSAKKQHIPRTRRKGSGGGARKDETPCSLRKNQPLFHGRA
jgi:hypothetical protein